MIIKEGSSPQFNAWGNFSKNSIVKVKVIDKDEIAREFDTYRISNTFIEFHVPAPLTTPEYLPATVSLEVNGSTRKTVYLELASADGEGPKFKIPTDWDTEVSHYFDLVDMVPQSGGNLFRATTLNYSGGVVDLVPQSEVNVNESYEPTDNIIVFQRSGLFNIQVEFSLTFDAGYAGPTDGNLMFNVRAPGGANTVRYYSGVKYPESGTVQYGASLTASAVPGSYINLEKPFDGVNYQFTGISIQPLLILE